jgi:signal-transduction protein with cAMP-binding, CBS, and nucleotidyltransferase domain
MHLPKHRIPGELVEYAYSKLFEGFQQMAPFSQEVLDDIRRCSQPVLYRQRQTVLDYGQTCRYCLFTIRGLVLSTFIMDGLEKIVWFMAGGDTVIAVHSWFDQEPSEEKLTALKETLCIALSWANVEYLRNAYPGFAALERAILIRSFITVIQRTKWQQYSVDGRIDNLKQLYPHLLKEVPAKHLASYLGISRHTLARKLGTQGEK